METELQLAQIEQDIIERFEPSYSMSDFIVYQFIQIWPSIDAGFVEQDGTSIAEMTYVFVAQDEHVAYVYFGLHFAYKANPKNKIFKRDLEKCILAPISDSEKYNK